MIIFRYNHFEMQLKIPLLHRYVVREFIPPFAIGLLVFTFVLILNNLFLMTDLFLNRGVGIIIIFKMAAFVLPMFIPLSIPMASLLAALLAYGRLSEDGELTALRSTGCSLFQYSFANLAMGLFLSLLLIFFNLFTAPGFAMKFKNLYHSVAQQNPLALFSPKIMNYFGEYRVIVDKMDREKKKMSGISIYRLNPEGPPTRILAPEGEMQSNPSDGIILELMNGSVHQPNSDKENEYTITKFNKLALRIPARLDIEPLKQTPKEMNYFELNKNSQSVESKNQFNLLKTEIHFRIAISFAPLFFILLGISLGSRFKKGSRGIGVGTSIIIILAYYGLSLLMISLSNQGLFHPWVLTWAPNLTVFIIASILYYQLSKQ